MLAQPNPARVQVLQNLAAKPKLARHQLLQRKNLAASKREKLPLAKVMRLLPPPARKNLVQSLAARNPKKRIQICEIKKAAFVQPFSFLCVMPVVPLQ